MKLRWVVELVGLVLYLQVAYYVFFREGNSSVELEPMPAKERTRGFEVMLPSPLPVVPPHRFQPSRPSSRDQYPLSSVALVTGYFRPAKARYTLYDQLFQRHVDRATRYAHLHSYPYFLENSHWQIADPHPVWSKLPAVWHHLPRYQWILWLDADAMISNFDISIEEILHRADQEYHIHDPSQRKDFLVSKDMNGLNYGVFLLRNSTWSIDFLHRAFDLMGDKNILNEQHAVQMLLQRHPEDLARTQYIPQRWINSYPHEVIRRYSLLPRQQEQILFQHGDFILHTPGLSVKEKLQCLDDELPPLLPDINLAPSQSIHWDLAVRPFIVEDQEEE